MKNTSTRRDFLKLVTNAFFSLGGLLGLGGLLRFFSFQPDPGPPTEFELGPKYEYPKGIQVVRLDIPAVIQHTDEGIIAISLVCTHLGCTVEENEDGEGFTCPCHGSRYSKSGNVLEGPATKTLPRYRIEEQEDGTLRLFTK
jgi:cytochrome b6-f complex iron-sulfur subunit